LVFPGSQLCACKTTGEIPTRKKMYPDTKLTTASASAAGQNREIRFKRDTV